MRSSWNSEVVTELSSGLWPDLNYESVSIKVVEVFIPHKR